ncbi:zinc finger FYVE domain-containing protein 26 homolog isoform X2 [Drosophila eugracilis]|uniref:zinc finger FYVE domain-containing protein 26 homolog isoform X2 n=1 Tax=Drosophila eugracilis TaxID=29029 RepID=UPI001BDB1057|nr:zinc finger FYVE domain-containing protein 26 homolog isoform X2 [Drosophila eugracilis]
MGDQQEKNLLQLLELLPKDQRQTFIQWLHGKSSGAIHSHQNALQLVLEESPYPALQLLQMLHEHSKLHIGQIISTLLRQLLDDDVSSPRFLCVLANFPARILEAATLRQKLMTRLVVDSVTSEHIMLALLARSEGQLLEDVLQEQELSMRAQCSKTAPTRLLILWLAHSQREHFVASVCQKLKDFKCFQDPKLRNTLLILRLANEFALGTQTLDELGCLDKFLDEFDVGAVPEELRDVHQFFFADFHRLSTLLNFLRPREVSKTLKVDSLLRAPGVLSLIHENGIRCEHQEMLSLLEDTYKWQQQTPALKCHHQQEVEILSYYTALCHVFNIVLDQSEQTTKTKLVQLSGQLRQLHQLGTLCSLLEDIFLLVFLRWEQLDQNQQKKRENEEDDEEDDDEQYVDDDIVSPPRPTAVHSQRVRYGFICRSPSLQALFTFLKAFVTKKLHSQDYKSAPEHQERFQRLVDGISEALWKLSVLQKIEHSLIKSAPSISCLLEPEQLLQLVQLHNNSKEKASSDDESRERSNHASSLNRRKARRQRRAASFSGAVAAKTSMDGGLTVEQFQARAQLLSGSKSRKNSRVTSPCERSIIPKMLSTPEQLAIMALALKNFTDVKQIIQTFHLEQSQLNREMHFMEQQQQVKQKLATIYANYQALEAQQARSGETTVEQIKSVAAKGFELSKIISVVDNFAQAQRLQQSTELKALILRHSSNGQQGFLQQFEDRNLNALIICDLIVNLGFNREITSNLLLVIRRQQQQKMTSDEASSSNGSAEIGAMNLLQNLCECMRLLEKSGQQSALNELLSSKSYPLRPSVLALQLQREVAFQALYQKEPSDYSHGQELRSSAGLFQQLRSRYSYYARFCSYVQQLARLLQLRDPNLEYHTTHLLRNDPYEVIGELIYECGITPLEIEASVAALHLNLVHVIALNICPQLSEEPTKRLPRVVAPQKQESIHNYITQHNQLLAQILLAIQLGYLPDGETGLNFSFLGQMINLPEMEILASMHEGNRVLAALNTYKLDRASLDQMVPDWELQLQILLLGIGGQSDSQKQINSRIDQLIADLIDKDPRNIHLVVHMSNLGLRARLLKEHFTRIPSSQQAKELIERTLQHRRAAKAIPSSLRSDLEHTLSDITIYAKVSALLQFESWPQAYDFGRQTPNVIFEQLLQRRRYGLCLEWSRVVFLAGSAGQQRVCLLTLLDALLELQDGDELDASLLGIVEMFPAISLVNFLDTHKDKFRSLPLLQWVIDYLESHARDPRLYRNYQLSLEFLRQMDNDERSQFWKLLRHPLLIVEQLVMNARFELLGKLLDAARSKLQKEKPLGPCPYCFEKTGHVYDVRTSSGSERGAGGTPAKLRFQLGQTTSEAFILLNFNSYQQDHFVGQECLDLLLRIYASKALDYNVANVRATSEPSSLGTDVQNSLDSLCGAFVMPKQAPNRQQWTRDEEASHCMCCRRAAFTMLMRRHHCRRCGRVVCYACSTHRLRIPELYDELEVRICNDCASSSAAKDQGDGASSERSATSVSGSRSSGQIDSCKWRLSGIITHDKLLREEFSYEHAPSVALSLSILRNHVEQRSCVDLLLFHCRKLEKLIVPNPEVDYGLVAKMINCLAFAAKVRGAPGELENIREHSEIIMAVVQQGCESLIPTGQLNNHNLRKLADALVETEHWTLALEVHLKCGFATTGVMAAHGLACLRAGCYDAAREKFAHCMTRLSSEQLNSSISKCIFGAASAETVLLPRKRPQRGPALLQEILQLIAAIPQTQPQPETLHRASLMRNSNTSLASLFTRRREPYVQQRPLQEPALNVINALAGLKNIAKGHYGGKIPASEEGRRQERGFEESLHYVLTYGSHSDILTFLIRREELRAALRYWQHQQLDADLFIQHIFQPQLANGGLNVLMDELQQLDDAQLTAWRLPLLQTCRHLEQHQQLSSLYQLQLLLKDPIRASMTCVKFYALQCENFQKLHSNAQHLLSAHMHLQGELDLSEWEHLQRQQGRRNSVSSGTSVRGACFAMQMDARALNGHINTIRRQLEVAKFLAKCEREQAPDEPLRTIQTLKQIRLESSRGTLPTLFEGAADRIQLCILILMCGKNIDEGFGLAYGIMQDYKLAAIKVFGATSKYLARNQRLPDVERLLDCIGSNNGGGISGESDEILSIAINAAVHSSAPETKQMLDRLIKRIGSVELRVSSYIYIGQLKSAYLLAIKHERLADVRRILRQAELTGQVHIKKLCEMKLQLSTPPTPL